MPTKVDSPPNVGETSNSTPRQRFAGLDTIRFVCAYLVVSSHSGSLLQVIEHSGRNAEVIGKVLRDLVNGPAAVIAFFVISGFCIHAPYRDGARLGLDYFVRRYLRIGIPLAVALILSPYFGVSMMDLVKTVLWSLYCELVYYTIYPVLRWLAFRTGWHALTAVAFIAALVCAVALRSPYGSYTTANVLHDSVIGLPCWLMGCLLAERRVFVAPSMRVMWVWRVAVFSVSVVALEFHFHTPIRFDVSLNFFAILVFFWLARELGYYRINAPPAWLERAGIWSYSLYIFHPAGSHLAGKLFPDGSSAWQWAVRLPLTLTVCYLFHRAVERPSHELARGAAVAVRSRFSASVPPVT